MAETWTNTNPYWQVMSPYQRAAAMSLMETGDPADATNVLGAMVNRARSDKADLGVQVGTKIYQPSIEPTQEARLDKIIRSQHFQDLSKKAESYWTGKEEVPHKATHFLASEQTMLALERNDPQKYKSWRNWTGFNPQTGEYSNVAFRDKSHAFITPGDQKPLQYTQVTGDPFQVPVNDKTTPVYDSHHTPAGMQPSDRVFSTQPIPLLPKPAEVQPKVYTATEAAAMSAPPDTTSPEQWQQVLKEHKYVQSDELKAFGVMDFLKERQLAGKPVSQDEIVRMIGNKRYAGAPIFMQNHPFPLEPVDHDPYSLTPTTGNPFA